MPDLESIGGQKGKGNGIDPDALAEKDQQIAVLRTQLGALLKRSAMYVQIKKEHEVAGNKASVVEGELLALLQAIGPPPE